MKSWSVSTITMTVLVAALAVVAIISVVVGVATHREAGELLNLTIHHELGHCLGLAHDDFEQSIMRREQSPTPWGQLPPWISDDDRALVRSLYAPRAGSRT